MRSSSNGTDLVIGLMSGTSADGIDAVLAAISPEQTKRQPQVKAHVHVTFPPALRRRILVACQRGTASEICELNFVLGECFARAALAVLRKARLKPSRILAIGSHGQTVHHLPNGHPGSTLQIGEPSVIAERTGITTVADFRVRDMAAGGQGAPLVPLADWMLFSDPHRPRIIQNIGGIGNLTFLPACPQLREVFAFDTGPGNMVIDALVSRLSGGKLTYDRNGQWARRGQVSEKLCSELMAHPFLHKTPPKTTGREEFGDAYAKEVLRRCRRARLKPADAVATATAFTAATIADACRRYVFPKLTQKETQRVQMIVGGGGAKNPVLKRMIQERIGLPGRLFTHADFGIDNSAKEALAFAILARETLAGRPGNVVGATGARRPVILGKIVPGR